MRGDSERTALGLSSGLDSAFKRDGTPASWVAQGWACRFLGRGMVAEHGDGAVGGGWRALCFPLESQAGDVGHGVWYGGLQAGA